MRSRTEGLFAGAVVGPSSSGVALPLGDEKARSLNDDKIDTSDPNSSRLRKKHTVM